jgi:hypothetical protein
MITLILIITGWLTCSFITYGFSFAYFQNRWPKFKDKDYKKNRKFCFKMSLFGPLNMISYFLTIGCEGFKYGFKIL